MKARGEYPGDGASGSGPFELSVAELENFRQLWNDRVVGATAVELAAADILPSIDPDSPDTARLEIPATGDKAGEYRALLTVSSRGSWRPSAPADSGWLPIPADEPLLGYWSCLPASECLAHEIRAHLTGLGSLVNTLLAVHGVSSPAGRIVDDCRFSNPGALLEALTGRIVDTSEDECGGASRFTPTVAAATMRAQGLVRSGGRRAAMPHATQAAVVAYVREHVELLERARELAPDSSVIGWHYKRAVRLRDLLGGGGAA